jgi:hypothetical protein
LTLSLNIKLSKSEAIVSNKTQLDLDLRLSKSETNFNKIIFNYF